MKKCALPPTMLCCLAIPLSAQQLSDEFKATFEKTFRPHRTYVVLVRDKIPTVSIYGLDGKQTSGIAHFSIDIKEGEWEPSQGFLDTNQQPSDVLSRGELLELDSISYKENRVDLRLVSVEAHKVTRGAGWLGQTKREPVATNFKFFLPAPKGRTLTADDMPAVLEYLGAYLRPFPNEEEARTYAASLLAGQPVPGATAPPPRGALVTGSGAAPGSPDAAKRSRIEIKVGMSLKEVEAILGKPQDEVTFQNTTKWTYPNLTVIFENGKVKDVKF